MDDHHAIRTRPAGLIAGRELFTARGGRIVHQLGVGKLEIESSVSATDVLADDPKGTWWRAYLEGLVPDPAEQGSSSLRTVDLFCGPGGLANGLRQLCAEIGVSVTPQLIVDQDEQATRVYAANHRARRRSTVSVSSLVDFSIRRSGDDARFLYLPELTDDDLARAAVRVDLLLAGPPCQGHSNLNNHTRREDPRNDLYLTVPAFAVAIGAPICIIENVPAILNDSDGVVGTAGQLFQSAGYEVETGIVSASAMGWPQARKRHFMIARRDLAPVPLKVVAEVLAEGRPRSLWWAIGDLEDLVSEHLLDQPTILSLENTARVNWLFENDAYDLDLPERPNSHRGGTTYVSVYGRLRKDAPAQTITTGFMSPGRGRYIHPTRRRVLTAREAARLQGFPDTYGFVPNPAEPPSRAKLAKWIGDAVPMPLGYAAALSALGRGLPGR